MEDTFFIHFFHYIYFFVNLQHLSQPIKKGQVKKLNEIRDFVTDK